MYIVFFLAFLVSMFSATALTGLLLGFRFVMIIFDLSLTILHLLGLNALIGAFEAFF